MIDLPKARPFLIALSMAISCGAFSADADAKMAIAKPANVEAPSVLIPESPPDSVRPTPSYDPAREQMLRFILAKLPELKQKAAPFLRIAIPDPLEPQRLVGLRSPPPDTDAPAGATVSSIKPRMPINPPAAAKP